MKTMFWQSMVATLALLATGEMASANYSFTFSNVNLTTVQNGGGTAVGTLTGTFTTNNALTSVLSYDITASAAGSFAGYHYTTTDSSVTDNAHMPTYFQIDSNVAGNELRIAFSGGGLTVSGGTISNLSYESETFSGGNRYPTGTVVQSAVPEPSSIVLTSCALAIGLGTARLRRVRKG